jgi:hypothetical protein
LSPSGEADEPHDLPHEKTYSAKHLARLAAHYPPVSSRRLIQRHCAIIQYLKEMADQPNFRMIVLTHNFDFFRTLENRAVV